MDRYADKDILRLFRADAAFAIPALYETFEATAISTPFVYRRTRPCKNRSPT